MNLNFVLGTAAELIKVYPIMRLAREQGHTVRTIASGQSQSNFMIQYRDFALPESDLVYLFDDTHDLATARDAASWFLRALFARGFRKYLALSSEKDLVLVHGDTLTSLVGAWLGWRSGLRVAHIEAGLRSPRLFQPFPEEITRRLVSRFASFHFAPDAQAKSNLIAAHVGGEIICTQGNTLLDAVRLAAHRQPAPSTEEFTLVNIHRFENLNSGRRWAIILDTVLAAAENGKVIFVTHPQTQHKIETDERAKRLRTHKNIEIRSRMPFSEFIGLLHAARYLISDGGSNQEECSYLGKPCLLLRDASERQEGLTTCCVLSHFDPDCIRDFLRNPQRFSAPPSYSEMSPAALILDTLRTS